jgi:hypothetical protein
LNAEEILIPFPRAMTTASQCKSTLLVSSIRTLQERGHYERYQAKLPRALRETVLEAIAGTWLPMDAAIGHYEACDSLGLTAHEQFEVGLDVGKRIQRSSLNTLVKLAAATGVTPWAGLRSFQRLYERLFAGGGSQLVKLGPKDARVEVSNLPLARIPYFVHGYRGVIQGGLELFAKKAFVNIVPKTSTPMNVAFHVAWA